MRFWDSSALVPLIVEERGTAEAQRLYRSDPDVLVWTLSELEVLSALCRRRREGALPEETFDLANRRLAAARAAWHEVRDSGSIRSRARRLLRAHPLRAADALQLAAALVALREDAEGVEFLTYDARLGKAARVEGFLVPF